MITQHQHNTSEHSLYYKPAADSSITCSFTTYCTVKAKRARVYTELFEGNTTHFTTKVN